MTVKGMGNDLVREGRKRQGLTQSQLAERAGTTQSAIARLESGATSPSFDQVLHLLRLMGLDLDFMLVERDDADWAQAQSMMQLSPNDRFTTHERLAAQLREWREFGNAA